jgi:outer membrane protein TolC
MDKTLTDLTVVELKALAYDQMAQLELAQNNLRIINQELNRRINSVPQSGPPPNFLPPQRPVIEPLPPGSIQSV